MKMFWIKISTGCSSPPDHAAVVAENVAQAVQAFNDSGQIEGWVHPEDCEVAEPGEVMIFAY